MPFVNSDSLKTYIAHYRQSDGTRQSVETHCREVSQLCSQFAEPLHLKALGALAGLLHDMGKLSDNFQEYIEASARRDALGLPRVGSTVDHGKDGATLILERYHSQTESPARQYAAEMLAMVIARHHGGLQDFIDPDAADAERRIPLLHRCVADDQYRQSRDRFFALIAGRDELDALFAQGAEEIRAYVQRFQQEPRTRRMFLMQLLLKQLYSCLIDADRLQTYLFESNQTYAPEPDPVPLWEGYATRLRTLQEEFRTTRTASETTEHIRRLRCEVAEDCAAFAARDTGIYSLTVPTGGGKTLSSLWYALEHARIHGKKRIVYVIPYTTIIEQNARTVRDLLDCGDNLLEHHSHALCEDTETDTQPGNMSTSAYLARKLLTERWETPLIFTTMVQFLETVYAGGTQKIRRFHQLTDTILIFDEVQSTPVHCLSLFNECLHYLKTYANTTCVLCSATQPALDVLRRPLTIDAEMIPNLAEKFDAFRRMDIVDWTRPPLSVDALADTAAELLETTGSVLVITNTTGEAAALYQAIRALPLSDTAVYYLSTRLCPAHRQKALTDLRGRLAAKQRTVCVSTRLIEAGVDVSFGTVLRLLAGMDSVAQAAGRGNRHGEAASARTYVVKPEKEAPLTHMREVACGIRVSEGILHDFAADPERFGNDLLSPLAMREYYRYYFSSAEIQSQEDYPVTIGQNRSTTLYKLLSGANVREDYQKMSADGDCPLKLGLCLGTAAKAFRVIDDDTIGIVVPYGEGRMFIERWLSDCSLAEQAALLRKMQGYTVNVLGYQLRALEAAGALHEHNGVLLLDETYYDPHVGVTLQGREMPLLTLD